MPTNEQRRQVAKRKLERQLERRAERGRRRRRLQVLSAVVGVVVLVAGVALVVSLTRGGNSNTAAAASSAATPTAPATSTGPSTAAPAPVALPAGRSTPLAPTVDCTFTPATGQPAAKPNTLPAATAISTQGGVAVTMTTSAGAIPLTLDRALAPCTVASFLSLTSEKYFDGTPCHRLTTQGIKVLQCGDPAGTGKGGPGYTFANEFPTDQFPTGDPAAQNPATYPRATLAMANAGPGTNGSQFFLVYGDSPLPPQYTVFGSVGAAGLSVLDAVAAAGTSTGSGDGAPKTPVTITTMTAAA